MTQRESRGAGPDRPVLTRRERQRLATFDEIVELGRSMLRDGREVTLRALAAEMGLTPPALYRYVKNPAALNELLSDAIFADVAREMVEAGEVYGEEDPAAQIVAAATAFRDWALDNKSEFQLVFVTNSLSGERTIRTESGSYPLSRGVSGTGSHGVELFADHFGGALARLSKKSPFPVPAPDELDPDFVAVHSQASEARSELAALLGKDALGMVWLFEFAWAQLFAIVTLEVYGHVRPQLIKSGVLFRAQMREIGARVGMSADWDRLVGVSQAVAERRAKQRAGIA
ncbi:TetR/AcrR family transcriptional regulator [Kribbella sp. NPDC056345]|uniref:TetR/AcrR family transcriptional regulator n=1 Tax=Kribbella sp. NPDC056345 TaxID=3345789 RepID=UPI0035D7496E